MTIMRRFQASIVAPLTLSSKDEINKFGARSSALGPPPVSGPHPVHYLSQLNRAGRQELPDA